MDDQQKVELEFHKFEYDLVNGKLNLSVSRVDKLWIGLGSTVVVGFVYLVANPQLEPLFALLPMIVAAWLAMYLYVLSQIETQKIVAMSHAQRINEILGSEVLVYDLKVQHGLWRYGRLLPSGYALAQNFALFLPAAIIFAFALYKGFGVVAATAGTWIAVVYALLSSGVLVVGVISFISARIKQRTPLPTVR